MDEHRPEKVGDMAGRHEARREGDKPQRWSPLVVALGCCVALGGLPALAPLSVAAHADGAVAPDDLWAHWRAEPLVIVGALLAGWLYGRGVVAIRRAGRGGRGSIGWRAVVFSAGLAAVLLALVSPLDTVAGTLFSAHMVQHVLLVAVAPPFLLLGMPVVVLLNGLPRAWRATLNRWGRRGGGRSILWHHLTQPMVAWVLHAATIWLWHLPPLYQAAVRHEAIHLAEHLSFVATAMLFWWGIIQPVGRRRLQPGLGTLSLFTMGMQGAALGALLTFSQSIWYPIYAGRTELWSISTLSDQRLAGLIMWIPAGTIYVLAALLLVGRWLQASGEPLVVTDAVNGAPRWPADCDAGDEPPTGTRDLCRRQEPMPDHHRSTSLRRVDASRASS